MKYIDTERLNAEIERLYDGEAPKHDPQCNFDDGYFVGIDAIAQFISTLESEKPINPDDAMKELDEKIALVKQRGTWDGVDVDKYMDEVRGRESEKPVPNDLEEAKHAFSEKRFPDEKMAPLRRAARIGYEAAKKDLGWISVKDRLPDTTEYVFTCIKMDGKPQCVGFHYYKDGKWWEGYEEDTVGAVEYWMQIPQFKEAKQ